MSKCVLGVEGDGTCVQVGTCSMYVCTYVLRMSAAAGETVAD